MPKRSLLGKFLIWRHRHMDEKYFLIILSVIIGLLSGVAVYLLKTFVFHIQNFVTNSFNQQSQNYWYVILPAVGILLTVLFVKYLIKDKTDQGVPRVLFVISKKQSKMKLRKLYSSLGGSSLTAAFGGSIGLESPVIVAGSSLGSSLGQLFRLNYKRKTLLIGCGAAGAIASIFTSPIAAVVFGLEVLMLDLTTASIVPLLIASVTGAITTKLLLSENILFHFSISGGFDMSNLLFYIVLGVLCGLASLHFNRLHHFLSDKLHEIKNSFVRIAIGGLVLGLLIFMFPPLYGEGYDAVKLLIDGKYLDLLNNSVFYDFQSNFWVVIGFMFLLILLKVVATTLTTESGGIGGIFAPSAVTGGFVGFTFAKLINQYFPNNALPETHFTLVGMAGVLGGVLHAPLTAIFLIAEITNSYTLIVPLMLVTAISYITIKTFDPHSIFTKKLAESGDLITHHKDRAVLKLMNITQVIDKDLKTVRPGAKLHDLTLLIAKSKRNLFPVVDKKGNYKGLVVLDDVREDMFKKEKYDTPISEYIIQSKALVSTNETMESVMEKFNKTGNYNLPVVDKGKYIGFVSRANIFSAYRKILIDVSDE